MDKRTYKLGVVIALGLLFNGFVGLANLLNWHGSPAQAAPNLPQRVLLCDEKGSPLALGKGENSKSILTIAGDVAVYNGKAVDTSTGKPIPVASPLMVFTVGSK